MTEQQDDENKGGATVDTPAESEKAGDPEKQEDAKSE